VPAKARFGERFVEHVGGFPPLQRRISLPRSLSDLSRPAAENGNSAQISLRFRHSRSQKLLECMKILARGPIHSLRRSKSDRLLGAGKAMRTEIRILIECGFSAKIQMSQGPLAGNRARSGRAGIFSKSLLPKWNASMRPPPLFRANRESPARTPGPQRAASHRRAAPKAAPTPRRGKCLHTRSRCASRREISEHGPCRMEAPKHPSLHPKR